MSRSLLLANRILPALTAAVAVMVGGWQLAIRLPSNDSAAPLVVSAISLPSVAAHPVNWPSRNLFSADGIAWILPGDQPVAAKETGATGSGKVMGVVNLPDGPKGVMVDRRFIGLGGMVGGGRLKDVRDGVYVVEIDGREQEWPLDAGRQERIGTLLKKRER